MERTSSRLYSKLELDWCLWYGDLQPLPKWYLPFSSLIPYDDSSQSQHFSGTACQHYPVTGNRVQHQVPGRILLCPKEFRCKHTPISNYNWRLYDDFHNGKAICNCASNSRPSDRCNQCTCLALEPNITCNCSGSVNKLQSLISSKIVKYNQWSDWDPPSNTLSVWLARSVILVSFVALSATDPLEAICRSYLVSAQNSQLARFLCYYYF